MRIARCFVFMFAAAVLMLSLPVLAQESETTLYVTSLSDMGTLDPAQGYDTYNWPTEALVYRGLLTYDDDLETLIPALAESYEVSDDGLTYTFVLRDGVVFSNGRAIVAEDVKYSFERILNPKTASPGSFMYEMIVGAREFMDGDADEVSGIKVIDDRTVEFTLTYAEWTFGKRLALNFGAIVPREHVEATGDEFRHQPLGAGPFILESWEVGKSAVFVRNPNYYREGYPKVDRIEVSIGVDPAVGVLRVEAGEADTMLDWLPSGDYPRIAADPALADNLVPLGAFPHVSYITLDWQEEPFNNLQVRQALSMAIDRERLSQILNNRAVLPNGPLNPTVPGDNKDLPLLAYDPEGAKALLAEAGFPDGFSTTIHTTTIPANVTVAQSVIQDWSAIGVQAELITLDVAPLLEIAYSTPGDFSAAIFDWYLDYTDPSNLYQPLLRCGTDGNWGTNWGRHCNEAMDAMEREAALLPPGDERWAAYGALEAAMAEELSFIPLYHLQEYYYVSDRVRGLTSHPAYVISFENASVEG